MTPDFDILLEDPHLIVANKPAPLLTQAPPGIDSLEARVKAYIKQQYAKPAGVYLGVPHRLDRPVTGAIVFARNTKAAQRVHAQFHDRTVGKTYWALVTGSFSGEETWIDHLKKLQDEARTETTTADDPLGKFAKLTAKGLKTFADGTSLVELTPETGRSHQLRVQCATRGFPILGDELYGSTVSFGPPAIEPRDQLIALHARTLAFDHPFAKTRLSLTASLPATWPDSVEWDEKEMGGRAVKPTVAVIGASSDRRKYGNKAVRAHLAAGFEVFPIHPSETVVEGLAVYRSLADVPADRLDRVTVYLPPPKVLAILGTLTAKPIGSFILNPGTESPEVLAEAERLGLKPITGCSILAAGVTPDQFPDE